MSLAPQSKSVRTIVLLESDGSGAFTPVTLYKRKKDTKKVSRPLRPLEKAIRKFADAAATGTSSYAARHQRSNGKKKNGWLKDMKKNVSKAAKQAKKKL